MAPRKSNRGKQTPFKASQASSPALSPSQDNSQPPLHNINIDISKFFIKATECVTEQNDESFLSTDSPSRNYPQPENGLFITEQNLKSLISEAIESALSRFSLLIKNEITSQSMQFCEKVEANVHDIAIKCESNEKAITSMDKMLSNCEQNSSTALRKASALSTEIAKLKNALNENEQYSRRTHIRMHGVMETEGETNQLLTAKVAGVLKESYNVPLASDDIEVCHRVGPFHKGSSRQVIVRFLRRGVKEKLFREKKHIRLPNIRIFHDLTQANNKLLYNTKHHERVESAWVTFTGKILAKGVNGKIIRVDLDTDITSALNDAKHKATE